MISAAACCHIYGQATGLSAIIDYGATVHTVTVCGDIIAELATGLLLPVKTAKTLRRPRIAIYRDKMANHREARAILKDSKESSKGTQRSMIRSTARGQRASRPGPLRPAGWESGRKVDTNCMGKASRGAAWHQCMLDATDLTYLPVVLEILIYAAISSVLCAI